MPEMTTLPSGLRIISDEMPVRSVTIGLWVNVGARHEHENEHGLAHLLEHMAFKGTNTRTAQQIVEEVEDVGGIVNAYTGKDQTAYYMRVLSRDVRLATDILSDIFKNSIFDNTELDREKGVVIQEIGECEDNPDDVLFDNLNEISYPHHILGKTILGTRESIKDMTRQQIISYVQKYYHAHNVVFAASGGIKHQELLALAQEFMNFSQDGSIPHTNTPEWVGGVRVIEKDLEQVHLALSVPSISSLDNRFFASEIFSMIYGGSMSSRLFQEVREKRGLVYSISSFSSYLVDTGCFGFYAGTSAESATEVLDISLKELLNLSHSVKDEELNRAKAQLRSGVIMSLENPSGRIEAAVRQQMIFNKFFSPDELIERIDSVTKKDICDFGAYLLSSSKPAYCMLGAVTETPEIKQILDNYFN